MYILVVILLYAFTIITTDIIHNADWWVCVLSMSACRCGCLYTQGPRPEENVGCLLLPLSALVWIKGLPLNLKLDMSLASPNNPPVSASLPSPGVINTGSTLPAFLCKFVDLNTSFHTCAGSFFTLLRPRNANSWTMFGAICCTAGNNQKTHSLNYMCLIFNPIFL